MRLRLLSQLYRWGNGLRSEKSLIHVVRKLGCNNLSGLPSDSVLTFHNPRPGPAGGCSTETFSPTAWPRAGKWSPSVDSRAQGGAGWWAMRRRGTGTGGKTTRFVIARTSYAGSLCGSLCATPARACPWASSLTCLLDIVLDQYLSPSLKWKPCENRWC